MKVVGKIDLEQFKSKNQQKQERVERAVLERIDHAMGPALDLINERLASFEGTPENFLDEKGQIRPEAYVDVFSQESIERDLMSTHEQKKSHYHTYSKAVQERYQETDQDKLVELIEQDEKERLRDGNISENFMFLFLNKIAGDRYLVVRSSDFDDYENGTDLLLMDTQSGETICAFDVTTENTKDNKSRLSHKVERALKKNKAGVGMRLKYGAHFEFDEEQDTSRMVLGALRHVPPMALNVEHDLLAKTLNTMDFALDSELGEREQELITNLLESMENQYQTFSSYGHENISYEPLKNFIEHLKGNLDFVREE